ncbi:cupin domain-containing protein [Vibrio porteresiae]|uniref:AraC-type arabinose-binding/dimerisation domain-containing protein n=1 Tax=Vibrio porteresiae DSM 19223 TaxID=1123496 RepID=A0ABZ0QDG5_9VIBR|nr:hypothetical protein [Vibrio porteresiae]WPC74514.1 hypothetical protein R8Z52_04620 [Vibrio porteresiae DSM 19223]
MLTDEFLQNLDQADLRESYEGIRYASFDFGGGFTQGYLLFEPKKVLPKFSFHQSISLFILDGHAELTIEQNSHLLRAADLYIIPADKPFSLENVSGKYRLKILLTSEQPIDFGIRWIH